MFCSLSQTLESHYNVPRAILPAAQGSAAPSAVQAVPAGDAANHGIYSVPSSLPALDINTFSVQGQSFSLSADPYAQYDVPRPVGGLVPDEEAIYDYPENVMDMEIYDYPPDALSMLPPPPDLCPLPLESSRNSVVTLTSEFTLSGRSSLVLPEEWGHLSFPPPPPVSLSSSRPSIAVSTSSDEYYQVTPHFNSVCSLSLCMPSLFYLPPLCNVPSIQCGLGVQASSIEKLTAWTLCVCTQVCYFVPTPIRLFLSIPECSQLCGQCGGSN